MEGSAVLNFRSGQDMQGGMPTLTSGSADLVSGSFRHDGDRFVETVRISQGASSFVLIDERQTPLPSADGNVQRSIEAGSTKYLCFDQFRGAPGVWRGSTNEPYYRYKCAHGLDLQDMSYVRIVTMPGDGLRRNVRVRVGQCVKQDGAGG